MGRGSLPREKSVNSCNRSLLHDLSQDTTLACRSRDRRPGLCVMGSLSTVTVRLPVLAAGIPAPRGN